MTGPLTAGEPLVPPIPRKQAPQPGAPAPKRPIKRRRGWFSRVARGFLGLVVGIIVLGGVFGFAGGWIAYQHFSENLPDLDKVRQYQPAVMSRVYTGDARLLAELATERRIFVPLSAIPKVVQQAFVSEEDQNFWTHPGVDPLAIVRAASFNLAHMGQGRRPIGASTITQQIAKNMLLDGEVSLSRKIREAILAMRIEETLSKERILELYLNEIYLGLGSYGVAAAAQGYFNKSLDELTLPEAAFLAALPKAPNNYNPFRFPDAAKARRDQVLDRMAEDHAITGAQATAAKATPIVPSEFRRPAPIPGADWFTEEVRRQLIAKFGPDMTTQGGLVVRTSLDPALQLQAETSLRDGLMAYDRKMGGWRGPVTHLTSSSTIDHDWATLLAQVARPPGMLPNWRLAVVIGATDAEAKLGWLEPAAASGTMPLPKTTSLVVSELSWARPVKDGKLGSTPRRIADVMQPGDVVMIEPPPAAIAQTPTAVPPPVANTAPVRGRPPVPPVVHAVLRQIPAVQGALVSVEPGTGRVLAMVGGWSFEQSQFNRVTQAQRQPGSSFKPMVYLTALEQGISPSQRFMDAPIVVDTPAGRWRPGNFEGTFNGPTPMRIALEQSLNLVTLHIAQRVGMDAVADTALAFHMSDSMPHVLPAALGAVDTTVMREAGAYASLAAGGEEVIPTLIDSVQDRDGKVIWRNNTWKCATCGSATDQPQVSDLRKQIADPQSVFQLVTMMQGVVQRGTGVNAGKGLNRAIAGKTGTSQDFTDAWFSGFTPDLETTVWVGFDNPASLGNNETGGSVAAPIWHDFMAFALKDRPVLTFPVPPGVTLSSWDSGSGTVTDAFKPDQTPGASGPLNGGGSSNLTAAVSSSGGDAAPTLVHGGIDSAMGGLY